MEATANKTQAKTPVTGKTQKTNLKESTQKLVSLSKRGLSKATGGDGKPPAPPEQTKADKKAEKPATTKNPKTGAAKVVPEAPKVGFYQRGRCR